MIDLIKAWLSVEDYWSRKAITLYYIAGAISGVTLLLLWSYLK